MSEDPTDRTTGFVPLTVSRLRSIPPIWAKLLKLAMGVIVAWAASRSVLRSRYELQQTDFEWEDVRWRFLFVAAFFYALAQMPMAAYWHRILAALGIPVPYGLAVRSFVAGQLGKYVPGKFMVVVLRSGLLQLPRSAMWRAITSVFIETFTYVAVGGFLASLGVIIFFREQRTLQLIAVGVMILMLLLTSPMLLRGLLRVVGRSDAAFEFSASSGIDHQLVFRGWILSLIAWSLSSASLYATLLALPTGQAIGISWAMFFRLGTSLAAAVVLGFVSMLPGGLGAREYVLDRLLVPMLGEFRALSVTILLRVIWLLTEVACSTILYGWPTRRRD